jgi:DNA polymerase III subunit alpha
MIKGMRFVSFHSHTTFSYGDGFGTVADHVRRVSDLGMSALALSEHGNVNSHAALEQEARKAGIKPIFGCEVYFSPPKTRSKFHLTLFAKNEEGYRNLNKVITQSYLDAYQYPTVLWESLVKNNAGLVAFSGCSDSLISCTLLGGKSLGEKRDTFTEEQYDVAVRRVRRFQEIFQERFYLECQRFPELARTCTLNTAFATISQRTNVPLIATADVHYPYPRNNEMQKILHAARRSSSVAVVGSEWEYDILLTYPENDNQIQQQLMRTGLTEYEAYAAIDNTRILAEDCTVVLPKATPLRFPVDEGLTADEQFRRAIMDGWKGRIAQRPNLADPATKEQYRLRILKEYKVIRDKDFVDYFLVVADLVTKAKDANTTVGPGRGSAAGSLICYLLGITEIDPLHPAFERMVFERFIDPTRPDMPDIDIDIDDELRWKTAQDARKIYGQENVANVANHTKYRGRKALQDIARAYGLPTKTFDAIGQRCAIRVETDDRVDDSIKDVLDSYSSDPDISALQERFGTQILRATQLEGNQHSMGIHAGGFVISSEPIPDVCAIYTKNKGTGRNTEVAQVIPYDKRDAEYLGMLKMDFLGLTTMGMIGLCREWTGMPLDNLYNLYYQDYSDSGELTREILTSFRDDDVMGIFQYEGGTTRQVVREVKPQNMDELAACNALSRPGPFYGGQTADYIAVKNGEKDWERIHPGFDKHVEWTYGQIVYQEQIMWILRDLAGFDTAKVLRVRKIIGKKLGEFQFTALWDEFKNGCGSNGVGEDRARAVWGAITTAAGYAFNTAHAYSYALIAWWQMYFKIHHPVQFFAASLAKNGDGKDNISRRTALLQDSLDHNVPVMPITTTADATWRPGVYGVGVVPGLQQIPGVGEATAADMIAWRDKQDEKYDWWMPTWEAYLAVKGVGAKTVENIKTFVAQDDPFGINRTEKQLTRFREQLKSGEFNGYGLPDVSQFVHPHTEAEEGYAAFVGLVANIVHRDEVETIRSKTGESVDEILARLDNPEKTKKTTIFAYDEHGEVALRISRWRYDALSPQVSAIKNDHHVIVGYGRVFEGRANSIQLTSLWVFDPD